MLEKIITILRAIYGGFTRTLIPASSYKLAHRSLQPLSTKYGYDRGKPIDRYYIEAFLENYQQDIQGTCLEITDDTYTRRFGGNKTTKQDVLDININNKKANIHGDLRQVPQIKSNTYNCIILTHVLGLIDDMNSAISELFRILKPGGVILFTGSSFSPALAGEEPFWRFTVPGVKYLFSKYFNPEKITTQSYGNVVSGQAFWVGMSQQDLTQEELNFEDPRFPFIITMRAVK